MEWGKPQFAFERNFLDWYERWLDEVISGELVRDESSWFGYNKGGSEEELLTCYLSTPDLEEKADCLAGLFNKKLLKDQTLIQIEELIKINRKIKSP